MESNASMHRVGIVLGIVVTEGGTENGYFSGSLGFTNRTLQRLLDIRALILKGVGE